MTINWYGEGCFRLQFKEATILTDPLDAEVSGLKPTRIKVDIVIKTLIGLPLKRDLKEEEFLICTAGEYEIKNIFIKGKTLTEESGEKFIKTIYLIEAEELKILDLGYLTNPLDPKLFADEEIDILIIPAGGKPFLDLKEAAKLINQLEPKIVVPSFYKIPGLKRKTGELKDFLKEFGATAEPLEKLTVRKKDLVEEKTKIVAFKI